MASHRGLSFGEEVHQASHAFGNSLTYPLARALSSSRVWSGHCNKQ